MVNSAPPPRPLGGLYVDVMVEWDVSAGGVRGHLSRQSFFFFFLSAYYKLSWNFVIQNLKCNESETQNEYNNGNNRKKYQWAI